MNAGTWYVIREWLTNIINPEKNKPKLEHKSIIEEIKWSDTFRDFKNVSYEIIPDSNQLFLIVVLEKNNHSYTYSIKNTNKIDSIFSIHKILTAVTSNE